MQMHHILASAHAGTLINFACSSVLLAFDFDGTLAPIALTPARARMRAATRTLLERVARQYPCVVISGRPLEDVSRRLEKLPLWHVFGDHGLEPWAHTPETAVLVGEWLRRIRAPLERLAGVVVEDKTYSVTVHYRQAPDKARARGAIRAAIRGLPNVRVMAGPQAINLIVRDSADKGTALQRSRRVLACETAIYVGDDETDEDAFRSAPAEQLLSIRIGRSRESWARYYLKSQTEIDRLLRALLAARSGGSTAPGRAAR